MNPKQQFTKVSDLIQASLEAYEGTTRAAQRRMWASIYAVIRRLELDPEGNIIPNTFNFKIIRELRGNLKRAIVNKQYKKGTKTFLRRFEGVKSKNDSYYSGFNERRFNANKTAFNEVLKMSVETTKNSLLNSGIDEQIIVPVQNILKQNITTGGSLASMEQTLRADILGDGQKMGRLARYSKQITTDAINQFNANYNQAVANDLKIEFYMYQGPVVNQSRDYCKERVRNGRWFHIKEIEESAKESWAGKIPTTTASNILTNRGGFNCNHQYIPSPTDVVPDSVKRRAASRGFFVLD